MNRSAASSSSRTALLALGVCAVLALSACSAVPITTVTLHPVAAPAGPAAPEAVLAVRTVVPIDTTVIPGFRWHVTRAAKKQLGASWHPGCPIGTASLRVVTLRYWGFDNRAHDGVLVLHQDVLKRTRAVFRILYERRFPFRSMVPVDTFPKASDDASMAADNTSAFNCRNAVASGPPSWSRHSYGRAIDLNPVENPYLFKNRVLPPAGARFVKRSIARPGLIRRGDPVYKAFIAAGYRWGGSFSSPDYQHFEQ